MKSKLHLIDDNYIDCTVYDISHTTQNNHSLIYNIPFPKIVLSPEILHINLDEDDTVSH